VNIEAIREAFPALKRTVKGKPVIFADNAATTLKSQRVIDAVVRYYTEICSNVHRGINVLAEEAEALYEGARETVADLLNASPREIVWVKNATEGINLASHLLDLGPDDEVVTAISEHHSNILPWSVKAKVRFAGLAPDGRVDPQSVRDLVSEKTKLVVIGHVSNVTGLENPVADILAIARERGALSLVDASQSAPHMPIDVKALGCDFLAFSGHKMGGPSGTGALYGREELLTACTPHAFGGGMVKRVSKEDYELEDLPHRFEAGTPNIEGSIGLGAAADFLDEIGLDAIHEHGLRLGRRLAEALCAIPGVSVFPETAEGRLGIAAFTLEGFIADDLAAILCNRYGIMTRSGVHCAEPLVRHFGQDGLIRVSLYLYNTEEEVDAIARAVGEIAGMFKG
jgi:cysteine desulfurase/selenocysteine lyase